MPTPAIMLRPERLGLPRLSGKLGSPDRPITHPAPPALPSPGGLRPRTCLTEIVDR